MLTTSNWRDWYHFRHQQGCLVSGAQFEDYVTRILGRFHDDFTNPSPAGALGDGGCDGLADAGTILYACYGRRLHPRPRLLDDVPDLALRHECSSRARDPEGLYRSPTTAR